MAITQRARRRPRRVPRPATITDSTTRVTETIRWSKVIAAQTRIASGHYDRDAVRSKLVEAVLRELKPS